MKDCSANDDNHNKNKRSINKTMESYKMEKDTVTCVKAAIQINEEGLQLLQQSTHDDAIDTFHEALSVLLDDEMGSGYYIDEYRWREKVQRDRKQHGDVDETNVIFPSATLPVGEIHNEIFTMFGRGIDVRTELSELPLSLSPTHFENLVVAVCSYNLGLSYHLKGLQTNNSESLSQAGEHYSISYARFLDCSKSLVGRVLRMPVGILASVNNLSHLHAFCRNLEQVSICVEELSQLLSGFIGRSPQLTGECRLFLQNVCYFQESVLCSAPAA